MDLFEQLERSAAEFGARLRLVRAEDWSRPTPCSEWDVRDLVNHVVGGALRYTMLLHGATADDVAVTRALDHLGEDPVGSFETKAQEVKTAFREAGALSRTVHHPAGDMSGEELLELRITEFAIHAWDLARALGADERLDPALVDAMWERLSETGTRLERGGYFSEPAGSVADTAPTQTKLLHLAGREPEPR
ncbi:MAG: TIGR03086 family metal-binding protein [Acidimicrobiales bacterium]|nr:TIGR03086 family protein [Actinomycetota bacterium]